MSRDSDPLLRARAQVLRDLAATQTTDPAAVSLLEEAIATRRWWADQWDQGLPFVAGLIAQDLQDELLGVRGRWPLCPRCPEATHALYIHPEIGGPDPTWVCEETGQQVAPLGMLAEVDGA